MAFQISQIFCGFTCSTASVIVVVNNVTVSTWIVAVRPRWIHCRGVRPSVSVSAISTNFVLSRMCYYRLNIVLITHRNGPRDSVHIDGLL